MKFEEVLSKAKEGSQIMNLDWNGLKHPDKTIMYIKVQEPDENSKNTESYFMMYLGSYEETEKVGGWNFQRFPWLPSTKDLFGDKWEIRELQDLEN